MRRPMFVRNRSGVARNNNNPSAVAKNPLEPGISLYNLPFFTPSLFLHSLGSLSFFPQSFAFALEIPSTLSSVLLLFLSLSLSLSLVLSLSLFLTPTVSLFSLRS